MMYLKIHKSYRVVVALCDEELMGKKFEDEKRQLHLREPFYKDRKIEKKEAIKILELQSYEDATFNIVGKESTQTAVEAGIIKKSDIDFIAGIPFALTLL